jgi:DNA-binding NtrC family response regulator
LWYTGRILVVDDEEPIRKLVVSMLASSGHECREAAGRLEALALLESEGEFDLLLDGIGLLEQTKGKYPNMHVVMVTGGDISVAFAALRNGAYDYLLKPFEREHLINTVSTGLWAHRWRLSK